MCRWTTGESAVKLGLGIVALWTILCPKRKGKEEVTRTWMELVSYRKLLWGEQWSLIGDIASLNYLSRREPGGYIPWSPLSLQFYVGALYLEPTRSQEHGNPLMEFIQVSWNRKLGREGWKVDMDREMKDIWHIPPFCFLSASTFDVRLGEKCMFPRQGNAQIPISSILSLCDISIVILQPETKMLTATRILHTECWGREKGRKDERKKHKYKL